MAFSCIPIIHVRVYNGNMSFCVTKYGCLESEKVRRNETYGVHTIHSNEPSAENPYPEVSVRLTPWVYGTAKNVPDEISGKIENSDGFKRAYRSMLAETNRVLYVGMTRPQDVLILCIDEPNKNATLLQWPKDDGVDTIVENIPKSGDWDVFGTGHLFKDFSLTQSELDNLTPYGKIDETVFMPLNLKTPSFEKHELRYLSPSRIQAKGDVASHHDFEKRIPLPSNQRIWQLLVTVSIRYLLVLRKSILRIR